MSDFLERIKSLSPKRLALLANELQSQLDAAEQARTEAIAIVGMGCRFPGGVATPDDYWRLLSRGDNPITEVPSERWDVDAYYDPDPSTPGKTYTRRGGFLSDVDQFDPDFFGISPREALHMDPQQRLLLEVSWEALERSGHAPRSLVGSCTGVYVAIGTNDYANLQTRSGNLNSIDAYSGSGNGFSFAAGRISYALGLQGPNMALDAACASSLMAVHMACESLRSRECELALVGGVNLLLSPETNIAYSRTRVLAPDGRCKTFDAAADGYVRSEGCAAVVLKRYSDAIADRDPILAVVRGSAMNHGGASGGMTIPNGSAQQTAIRDALARAKVKPQQIQYVETQGTGTPLGDAIEVRALGAVLKQDRSPQQPLWLASVKTNIGHTETASGLASLIKVVLSLQHQQMPPHLHLQQVNPEISLEDIPAKIPTTLRPWPQVQSRQLAGINAFGMSGTNAHIVVEAAPAPDVFQPAVVRPLHILPISAKTPTALRQLVERYSNYLVANPDVDLGDFCFTAGAGRSHFNYRLTFICDRTTQLQQQLADYLANGEVVTPVQQPPKVIFSFAKIAGIKASDYQLYETQPNFKDAVDRCAGYLDKVGISLLDMLDPQANDKPVFPEHLSTLLSFVVQYALVEMWHTWGIQPDSVVADGIGQTVVDCLSGKITLEVALQEMASQPGAIPPDSSVLPVPAQASAGDYVLNIDPHHASWDAVLSELASLYSQGVAVDWQGVDQPYLRQRLILPTYPFQRQRYWSEMATQGAHCSPLAASSLQPQRPALSREALLAIDPAQRQQRLTMDLCDRIAAALGVQSEDITPETFLNTLAFDSIMALELKFDLEKALGTTLSITTLLEDQDVATLSAHILQGISHEPTVVFPTLEPTPADRHQPFPLNDIQEAYWIGRSGLFDMGNVAAHVYGEFEGHGLDYDRLNEAFQRLIDRHDMLRTVLLANGQQQVLDQVPPYTIDLIDLSQETTAEEQLLTLRKELSHQIHDAYQWPLFTVRVAQLDEQRLRIFLSFDNLLVDGASLGLLCWEWGQFYQDLDIPLTALDISFRDYVLALKAFEQSEVYQRSLTYWRQRLDELPPAPELPLATLPTNLNQPRFTRLTTKLAPNTWQRLQQQAQQAGLTVSGLLVAAYGEILATWSKNRRLSLNLTTFNRLPLHPHVQGIVGDFTSLTLLAIDYTDSGNFWQRAKRVQHQLWQDLEHSYVSGVRVLRELAKTADAAGRVTMPVVFTSLLANPQLKQESAFSTGWLGDMVHSIAQTPQVWLDHQVYEEAGTLVLNWDSVQGLFPEGLMETMFDAYVQLLTALANAPEMGQQPRFELLPEVQSVLQKQLNATAAPQSDEYLHTLFLSQAALRPDHVAITAGAQTLTYGKLRQRSEHLARHLQQSLQVQPNQLVAIAMDKGWEQIVAALGILMSGAAYVPIDPSLPQDRCWQLLERSTEADVTPIVLTQSWLETSHPWPEQTHVLAVDTMQLPPVTEVLPSPLQQPTDLAYVIYTSGSTGLPKGVMIDHRGAVNTVLDINRRWAVDERDRVFALSSLSFDLSVYDIFGTLAAGGTIVLPPPQAAKDPAKWSEVLLRERVTIWNSVPALMQMLVTYAANRSTIVPTSLRLVLLSGDWLPLTLPEQIRFLVPTAQVVSLGGATEASIWSICYPINHVDKTWSSIPYGRPLANQQFYVLDAQLQTCPLWVPGYLYIGGIGLAKGYWRDPVKTAASFITHPRTGEPLYRTGDLGRYLPSGQIEFLGREDNQVKLGGYRIELGEVEAVLEQHPDVVQAVALVVGSSEQGQQLVTYVCLEASKYAKAVANSEELRTYLSQKLPAYMVPQGCVILEQIPLTGNGKIDRRHLQSLWQVELPIKVAYVPPQNSIQSMVAEIWQELLNREKLGIRDNFFELGGDSLVATQVMARIQELFQVEVSLRHLFEEPTVEQLAAAITEALASQIDPELMAALETNAELENATL